jgi:hypothetical protein
MSILCSDAAHPQGCAHTKRQIYFILDSLTLSEEALAQEKVRFNFPIDFVQTNHPKTITLINAKHFGSMGGGVETKGVSVHSDMIQEDNFDDSFLCFANENSYNRKLKVYDSRPDFSFWLKDMWGQPVSLDNHTGRLVLELLLEF